MIRQGSVSTIVGSIDQRRLDTIKQAIEGEESDDVVQWEGQDLLVSYAKYLIEYVEGELSKQNGGL